LGSKSLILSIDDEDIIVVVDKNGKFTVPENSESITDTDPKTGARLTINLVNNGTGTITNNTLYIKLTLSGSAVFEMTGKPNVYSEVSGTIVYNGTKK